MKDFSRFKKELKTNNLKFEFQLEEGSNAKIYKAGMTNRELLLIQEIATKEFKNEIDRTIEIFKIFLGDNDGIEVFNSLKPESIELVLLELFSEISGTSKEEMQEFAEKELNSPR